MGHLYTMLRANGSKMDVYSVNSQQAQLEDRYDRHLRMGCCASDFLHAMETGVGAPATIEHLSGEDASLLRNRK